MTAAQLETLSNRFPDIRQLVGEIIKHLVDNPGGGGGVTLYTGDAPLQSDRTVDLDGKTLDFQNGGNHFLFLNPAAFHSEVQAYDGTAEAGFHVDADLAGNDVEFNLFANDGTNNVDIVGNAQDNTLEYTADTHKFNNLQDFADNAAALLGGLEAGMLYYTDVAGDGILKVVI